VPGILVAAQRTITTNGRSELLKELGGAYRLALREPGSDRIDPDAELTQLPRQAAVHHGDRALRCEVGKLSLVPVPDRVGRDVDDGATPRLHHQRTGARTAQEDAPSIHRHHAVPLVDADLPEWLERPLHVQHDGGVVDKNADAAASAASLTRCAASRISASGDRTSMPKPDPR